jgi:hypothetical protein
MLLNGQIGDEEIIKVKIKKSTGDNHMSHSEGSKKK